MEKPPVTTRRVLSLWWPLAASWLLMGAEAPIFTAFVARMADPEVSLAAYGSVVFPVSLVIEGPIIMLLAASTALCRDLASYRKVRRFMMWAGGALTALHALVAFTPLYYAVVRGLLDVPEEVVEPARDGLRIMTPWTWAIAHRRFQQGVLIRFERSRVVGIGTAVRIVANAGVFALGFSRLEVSGIVLGTSAVMTGVIAEMLYVAWTTREVVRGPLATAPPAREPVTRASFLSFYVPLALTPLLALLVQPIGAAANSRMPLALESHASWSAVHGLVFLPRSLGFAFNEVVVALVGEPGGVRALRRFTLGLAAGTMVFLALLAATPLSEVVLGRVLGLGPEILPVARVALGLAVLMPAYQAFQSYYTGSLVHDRQTRGVTEAVALYLVVAGILLFVGTRVWPHTGLHWTIPSLVVAGLSQTVWLFRRSRPGLRRMKRASVPA